MQLEESWEIIKEIKEVGEYGFTVYVLEFSK